MPDRLFGYLLILAVMGCADAFVVARLPTRGTRVHTLAQRPGALVKQKHPKEEMRRIGAILDKIDGRLRRIHGLKTNESISASAEFEKEGVVEGDMVINEAQAEHMLESFYTRKKRKFIDSTTQRWDTRKPVPYILNPDDFTKNEENIIKWAMTHWEAETCIRFSEIGVETGIFYDGYIIFYKGKGCSSEVGKNGQTQISLNVLCMTRQIVAHEIGHALGFWHEQARRDRDDVIDVLWDNIQPGKWYNFLTHNTVTHDVPYDLSSLMHYLGTDFTKTYPDLLTLHSKNRLLQQIMGGADKLSFYDIKLANLEYCSDRCSGMFLPRPCLHDGYQDPNNCLLCKCPDGFAGPWCERSAFSRGADRCGGDYQVECGDDGVVRSPRYPSRAPPLQQCSWLIKGPPGSVINASIVELSTAWYGHDNLPCPDYVELRYERNLGATGPRFCGRNTLQSGKLTETNELLLLLRSQTPYGIYFEAKFTVICSAAVARNESADENSNFNFSMAPVNATLRGKNTKTSTSFKYSPRTSIARTTTSHLKTYTTKPKDDSLISSTTKLYSVRATTTSSTPSPTTPTSVTTTTTTKPTTSSTTKSTFAKPTFSTAGEETYSVSRYFDFTTKSSTQNLALLTSQKVSQTTMEHNWNSSTSHKTNLSYDKTSTTLSTHMIPDVKKIDETVDNRLSSLSTKLATGFTTTTTTSSDSSSSRILKTVARTSPLYEQTSSSAIENASTSTTIPSSTNNDTQSYDTVAKSTKAQGRSSTRPVMATKPYHSWWSTTSTPSSQSETAENTIKQKGLLTTAISRPLVSVTRKSLTATTTPSPYSIIKTTTPSLDLQTTSQIQLPTSKITSDKYFPSTAYYTNTARPSWPTSISTTTTATAASSSDTSTIITYNLGSSKKLNYTPQYTNQLRSTTSEVNNVNFKSTTIDSNYLKPMGYSRTTKPSTLQTDIYRRQPISQQKETTSSTTPVAQIKYSNVQATTTTTTTRIPSVHTTRQIVPYSERHSILSVLLSSKSSNTRHTSSSVKGGDKRSNGQTNAKINNVTSGTNSKGGSGSYISQSINNQDLKDRGSPTELSSTVSATPETTKKPPVKVSGNAYTIYTLPTRRVTSTPTTYLRAGQTENFLTTETKKQPASTKYYYLLPYTYQYTGVTSQPKYGLFHQYQNITFSENEGDEVSQWAEWSDWSNCSPTCGCSRQSRRRQCLSGNCGGDSVQVRDCNVVVSSCGNGNKRYCCRGWSPAITSCYPMDYNSNDGSLPLT